MIDLDLETYKTLFQFAKDAIIIERGDQSILNANPAAEVMFGYTIEELRTMITSDLLEPSHRDKTPHPIYTNPEVIENLIIQKDVMAKDESIFPAEITLTPIQQNGDWIFLSIIRDISPFKEAERAMARAQAELEKQVDERTRELQEREARYRNLVQSSLQGIMLFEGAPYKISFSNPAGSAALGYTAEELVGFKPDEIETLFHWTDRSKVKTVIDSILDGELESERIEARFLKKSNDIIWLDLSIIGVEIEDARSLIITFLDVTEQRQAIADLKDSTRDLELFSSLLRHDLKNDLQIITGNSEVIRLSAPDNDIVQEFAEANMAGVHRMLALLNIFGKKEKERRRLLAPILENISVNAAKSYIGLVCRLHIDPDIVMVRVIGGRMLSMVFDNLIRNSAKYAGENPRVEIRARRCENFIEVRVADSGPGIAEEIKPKLFERGVTTEGTGLGLYLSKKVIEAYGGTIELGEPKSDDEGAVFLVKLAITR